MEGPHHIWGTWWLIGRGPSIAVTRVRLHALAIVSFLAGEWSRYVWGWRAAGLVAASLAVPVLAWSAWRRALRPMFVMAASLASGILVGAAWAAWQPARPSAPPGARDVIAGQVQSVKVIHRRSEIVLAVRREGEDAHPCHYQALVFVERGARIDAGEWVEADGTFVASDRAPTAMDILSPLYLFDGRVRVLDRPQRFGQRVTAYMAARMEDVAPAGEREAILVALSMVFGNTPGSLPQGVSSDFLAAGVTHLLVASGSNVGFALDLAAIPWQTLFGRACTRRRRLVYGVYALCAVWGFALLCGFQLAIFRAACGATYSIAAGMCGRRVHGYTVLWSSAWMAGVLDPADLLAPSMLMSLYASFAVCEAHALWHRIGFGRWVGREKARTSPFERARRMAASLARAFIAAAIIDAYMVPVLWWLFRQWTPYGALSTAVLEPAVEVLMPLIVLWSFMASLVHAWPWPPIAWCAEAMSRVGGAAMSAVLDFVHFVASWHGSLRSLAPLSFAGACALVLVLVAVAHVRVPQRRG
ncbi:ComEC/Rec2 family competence protein [Alicyclobacillus sendaiensis]|uniref:ComEC/Rec2 family competence protein n=1 Tax=Alicyclobacillus sendaiensis TaxID=192387 RepID=UPI001FDEE8A1|nr:ComEC/Rec2 family competence protein [Alicyclobacillus sendaiensis]